MDNVDVDVYIMELIEIEIVFYYWDDVVFDLMNVVINGKVFGSVCVIVEVIEDLFVGLVWEGGVMRE